MILARLLLQELWRFKNFEVKFSKQDIKTLDFNEHRVSVTNLAKRFGTSESEAGDSYWPNARQTIKVQEFPKINLLKTMRTT